MKEKRKRRSRTRTFSAEPKTLEGKGVAERDQDNEKLAKSRRKKSQ